MAILTNYHMTGLKGGTAGKLDSIDGNLLLDGDRAWIILLYSGTWYFQVWVLDADSGAAENGTTDLNTTIVSPDTNAGTKRWLKCTFG